MAVSSSRKGRLVLAIITAGVAAIIAVSHLPQFSSDPSSIPTPLVQSNSSATNLALNALNTLPIKGRAPQTGYSRDQFGADWSTTAGCDTRDSILRRDLANITLDTQCHVMSGSLSDPYTGKTIEFQRGSETSSAIQIDHVVALSDAWQTGAQQLTRAVRVSLANDPLELLAVDGPSNQQKSDGDAATWLPSNKSFRCTYIARQIAVKQKYSLWVTQAEHDAMVRVLSTCVDQVLPS